MEPSLLRRLPAEGNLRKLLKASVLLATTVLAAVVSAVSSVIVGTLYPDGHTEEPSVALQLALRKLPLSSMLLLFCVVFSTQS